METHAYAIVEKGHPDGRPRVWNGYGFSSLLGINLELSQLYHSRPEADRERSRLQRGSWRPLSVVQADRSGHGDRASRALARRNGFEIYATVNSYAVAYAFRT